MSPPTNIGTLIGSSAAQHRDPHRDLSQHPLSGADLCAGAVEAASVRDSEVQRTVEPWERTIPEATANEISSGWFARSSGKGKNSTVA